MTMNRRTVLSVAAVLAFAGLVLVGSAGRPAAQVAGSPRVAVSVEELKVIATGWSAKKQILGKAVYNDKNEKIGVVDDLIVTPDRSLSSAIIRTGGFVCLGTPDAPIPVVLFKGDKDKIVLAGATRDALKAMPKFEYAK